MPVENPVFSTAIEDSAHAYRERRQVRARQKDSGCIEIDSVYPLSTHQSRSHAFGVPSSLLVFQNTPSLGMVLAGPFGYNPAPVVMQLARPIYGTAHVI